MSLSVFKVPQEEQEAILSYIENLNIREIANKVMQQLFVTLEMKYEFTLTNKEKAKGSFSLSLF